MKKDAAEALAAAQKTAKQAQITAVNAPAVLLKLNAQILALEKSSVPMLQATLASLHANASAAEAAAATAAEAVAAAQKVVMRADEKAAAAEAAWQQAEDEVDALLQKHNSLNAQLSTMAEFFQSKAAAAAADGSGEDRTPEQMQADLAALETALESAQGQVMSIQGTHQDTAAALAEARLVSEKKAAAAATAEEKFRAAAAQLAASEAVAGQLQQQLEHARQQLQSTGRELRQKQDAATAAALDIQGKQQKLVESAAAAKAARAKQEQATAAVATAVSASLTTQAKLSAAMAELQNLKAEQKNVMLDAAATEEQQRRLESLLASADDSALATTKVRLSVAGKQQGRACWSSMLFCRLLRSVSSHMQSTVC